MRRSSYAIALILFASFSIAIAECIDDLEGISNSASLDGKPLEGYGARTPEDFASRAISELYVNDPNNTIEKIVNLNDWAIIRDEARWADTLMSAVTGSTLPSEPGVFYNNNFAVCADNGQCAQVDFQINFVREDNVSGNFVSYFMDGMLRDMSQNGAWDSPTTVGTPRVYVYNVHGYTVVADLNGDIGTITVPSETLRETIDTLGALVLPSSYGTTEEQAAVADKTCRNNNGTTQGSGGSGSGGNDGDYYDPYDDPGAEWEESWGFEVRCWYIHTAQGTYSNCD